MSITHAQAANRVGQAQPALPPRQIPDDVPEVELRAGASSVHLTNLRKIFWPEEGITKRDLLQYYLEMAPYILPHLKDRAMVMRRYPNGINGKSFFMKRAPAERPKWLDVCSIEHTESVIDFPVVHDIPSLLYIVNLGCIDLNQWYATCDDVQRPDYLHFDLDPVPNADFKRVLETALLVRDDLAQRGIACYAKTTGSRGIHIYTPIVRGPVQKEVWTFAKRLAVELAARHPKLITAEYRIAKRPADHVLVDYNQNAWGRTLASVYSVRPKPHAPVSTPVTWEEIERGIRIEDFRLDNVPERVRQIGDLWKPLLQKKGRVKLERHL